MLERDASCKLIAKLLLGLLYSKTVIRNGKKHSHNKVSYNCSDLQLKLITIQEDHNIDTYSLFCLVVLVVEPLLLVSYTNQAFLYSHF